jgi:RNA polymerase sigma factor (sigma-70 family)
VVHGDLVRSLGAPGARSLPLGEQSPSAAPPSFSASTEPSAQCCGRPHVHFPSFFLVAMTIESNAYRRPHVSGPTVPLAEPSAPARQSASDEPALVERLAACRRELLAIALLDPCAHDAVERLASDLERRKVRIGATVELQGGSPEAARERFEAFRAAIGGLADQGDAGWQGDAPGALDAPQALADASGARSALEHAFQRRLALAEAARLGWDGVERLLEDTWVRAATLGVGRAPCSGRARQSLPPTWRRRVRPLDLEIHRIIQRLVAAHQGLVRMVARRYRGLGLSREDLMQEGNIGLLRAIEKFDASRGAPFDAYAMWWVRQSARRALANQARTIRAPTTVLAARYALGRAASRLVHELGREPSEHELARAAGLAPENVAHILHSLREPVSLDAPRSEGSSLTVGDRITDPDARSPNEQAVARDSAVHLRQLLGALSPREQLVLERRFGLGGADEQTLEEIGRSLDLTRERVRQIIAQALDRLQRRTRHEHLEL